ncbi:MFS transporter [Brevibacterium casei]
MPVPSSGTARRDVRSQRFWAPVIVIAAAQLVMIMNNAVLNIALPRLSADLVLDPVLRPWAASTYLLAFGALLLLGGRVGDRWGHRPAFITGLTLVTAASCLGAAAQNGPSFIAARALLGIGAALAAPAALALLSTTFPDGPRRGRAFGIYGAVTGIGAAVGVLSGGLLTDLFSWRWAVLVSAPLAAAAALLAPFVLTRTSRVEAECDGSDHDAPTETTEKREGSVPPPRRASLSVSSAGLIVLGVACLLLALTSAENGTWGAAGLSGGLALVLLTVFVGLQRRSTDPLLDLRLVLHPLRAIGLITVGAGGLGATGAFVMLSLAMQEQMGLSPMGAAIATLPYPVGMVLSSQLSSRIIDRFGLVPTALIGLLGTALAFVPLTLIGPGSSYGWLILPGLVLAAATMGPMFVAGTRLTMTAVPEGSAGTMGAVMNSATEITGAIGIGLLSLVASASAGSGYGWAIGCGAIVLGLSAGIVGVMWVVRCRAVTRR